MFWPNASIEPVSEEDAEPDAERGSDNGQDQGFYQEEIHDPSAGRSQCPQDTYFFSPVHDGYRNGVIDEIHADAHGDEADAADISLEIGNDCFDLGGTDSGRFDQCILREVRPVSVSGPHSSLRREEC